MAGRKLLASVETRVSERGGEEWLFEQIAEGRPLADIAEELGCSRRYLYMWRNREGHKERRVEAWEAAMRISAEVEVEKATADFERLDRVIRVDEETGEEIRRVPHPSEVSLVTGRAKFRQWLAQKKDPERYGDKSQVDINVNAGESHLAALRKARRIRPRHVEAQVEDVEEGDDYEVVVD